MFEVAEAYERQMGRWSRQLAPLFIEFFGVRDGDRVLDVACGTGALSLTLARTTKAVQIIGIDLSQGFVDYARAQNPFPQVSFESGDARKLPFADGTFDRCVTLLAVNHIGDAPMAVAEMRRVAKPGGVLAAAMWDGTGGNEFNDCMWTVAASLDVNVIRPSDGPNSYSSPEALKKLWHGAGLQQIQVEALSVACELSSFNELWGKYTEGQGPGGHYVRGLSDEHRAALKNKLRETVLRGCADGRFSLQAKAWAVRGVVPGP